MAERLSPTCCNWVQNEFARVDLRQQQQQRLRLRLRQLRRRCRVYQAGGAFSEARVSPAAAEEWVSARRGEERGFLVALLTVVRLVDSIVAILAIFGVRKMCL